MRRVGRVLSWGIFHVSCLLVGGCVILCSWWICVWLHGLLSSGRLGCFVLHYLVWGFFKQVFRCPTFSGYAAEEVYDCASPAFSSRWVPIMLIGRPSSFMCARGWCVVRGSGSVHPHGGVTWGDGCVSCCPPSCPGPCCPVCGVFIGVHGCVAVWVGHEGVRGVGILDYNELVSVHPPRSRLPSC